MTTLTSTFLTILWLLGIIIAKGFWSTFFAVIMPIYGWYLILERILAAHQNLF